MGSPEPAGRSPPAPAPASNEGEAETSSGSGSPAAVALPSSSPRSAGGAERPAGGLAKHQSARLSLTQATKALGKIELQIASGPQWTWIRRLLFGLFWVILICLLAAALVTIVQTPECKTPPKLEWWQKGPMYRVVLKSNRGIRDPKGILRQLQYIVQLNVVAIILVPNDKLNQTSRTPNDSSSFQYIMDYIYDLKPFLKAASKHGIKVVLDFTPFYAPLGNDIWTSIDQDEDFLSTLLTEFHFGFREGVDGIFLKISALNSKKKFMRELLKTWKEIASKYSSSSKKRIFIIGTNMEKYDYFASVLVNVHGVIIFVYYLSDVLKTSKITEIALILNDYYQIVQNEWSGFSLSEGHIASMILQKHENNFNLYAILLFTMPGTPLFYYGDEIALKNYKQHSEDPQSTLSLFKAFAKLRIEESPLLYGDFYLLLNTTNILAYIRQWDQMGILIVLNFGVSVTYNFTSVYLPSFAFILSKSTELSQCELINLQNMTLEANVGYILKYFIPE